MKKLLLVVFLTCACIISRAQMPDIKFDYIGIKEGLPELRDSQIKQDSYGYIWISTQNGLVRYDGYNYKVYQLNAPGPHELDNTSVVSIFEDSEKTMWFSTYYNGVFRYDRRTDSFQHFFVPGAVIYFDVEDADKNIWCTANDKNTSYDVRFERTTGKSEIFGVNAKGPDHIDSKTCYAAYKTNDGTIWIPSDNGLYRYNGKAKGVKAYFATTDTAQTKGFRFLYEAPSEPGVLWAKSFHDANAGLKICRFDYRANTLRNYLPGKKPGEIRNANCHGIYEDRKHQLWFGIDSGIARLDRRTGVFTNYLKKDSVKNNFSGFTETPRGNFWLTSTLGLVYFDAISGQFKLYVHADPYNPLHIILDNAGQLWVAGFGVHKTDYLKSAFHVFKNIPSDASSYPGGAEGLETADNGNYFSILGGLVYKFTPGTGKFKLIAKTNASAINDVCLGKNGRIYVACDDGIKVFDANTGQEISLSKCVDDVAAVKNVTFLAMCCDHTGVIWMGSYQNGVYSLDPKSNKLTHYPFKKSSGVGYNQNDGRLDDQQADCIYEDRQNTIWVGTNSGSVNRFDRSTGKFFSYYTRQNRKMFSVTDMHEDTTGRFWVGTYLNGLFEFDRKTGKIRRNVNERSGLLHNSVFCIEEDKGGNLILISQRGVTRYSPGSGKIQNFKIQTLFPGNDINGLVSHRLATNVCFFTLNDAAVLFDPAALAPNITPPIVHIENVTFSDPLLNDSAKNLRPFGIKQLDLPHDENRLKFDYVALHFDDPSQNKYAYKLDGYDKNWINAGTLRSVTYTNLSPGTYTFHVKACNSDGIWNNTGDSITIVIATALWMRWWAWLIYVILFAAAIYAFVSYRARALKRENQVLEEKVSLRTEQLTTANRELHEKQEEIITQRDQLAETLDELKTTQSQLVQREKMASLGELTAGIAHEIQNPLNFVNNFSEVNTEMLDELKQELEAGNTGEALTLVTELKQNEEKINHHGKRAEGIVKSMLEHSRNPDGQKEPTDLNKLADEYFRLAYHGLRAKDKSFNAVPIAIGIITDFDEHLPHVSIIPQEIGRVLLNLFNNAFYAVGQKAKTAAPGYKPVVEVHTSTGNGFIEIVVKDNGPGIPGNIRDKIMQPFFTTKPTGEGTGLGLSLSYDIVVKGHGGNLAVDTKENEFTAFIITLPIVK